MRLTTACQKASFALQQNAMKQTIAVLLILMVALNAIVLLPKSSSEAKAEKKECCMMERPKIELTEVSPGILPNLLKSTSSAL